MKRIFHSSAKEPKIESIAPELLRLSFSQILLAPLRTIAIGHIFLLVYLSVLVGGVSYGLSESHRFLIELIHSRPGSTKFDLFVEQGVPILLSLLLTPIILSAISLPVRTIWLYHKLRVGYLLRYTLRAIRIITQVLVRSPREIALAVVPVASLAVTLQYSQSHPIRLEATIALWVLFFVAFAFAIRRLLLILMCALICGVVWVDSQSAYFIVKGCGIRRQTQAMIIALLLLIAVLGMHATVEDTWAFSAISFCIWYFLSVLTALALEISEESAKRIGKTYRYSDYAT